MPTNPRITYRDIVSFFQEKVTVQGCACCGNGTWNVEYIRDDDDPTLIGALFGIPVAMDENADFKDKPVVVVSSHVPVRALLAASCTNCGYLRQFALKPFLTWLEARDKQNGDGASNAEGGA